jgi:hypothetical protein
MEDVVVDHDENPSRSTADHTNDLLGPVAKRNKAEVDMTIEDGLLNTF